MLVENWMRRLYGLLTLLLTPLLMAVFLLLSIRQPGYREHLAQRLGRKLPDSGGTDKTRIWIHAVSVGETLAIAPLIETLLARRPDLAVLVTSTTPTGAEQVRRLFGERVEQAWLPLDSPGAVARCLNHWRPAVLVLVETELWPQLINQCRGRGIKTLLLNARLSARSLRRYARLGSLARNSIAELDHIACQHAADARRFRWLGADARKVSVAGTLKFDIAIGALEGQRDALALDLGTRLSGRPVFLAASTHTGEDASVIEAFKALRQRLPNCVLWLAPRHPSRSGEILELLQAAGLPTITRHPERASATKRKSCSSIPWWNWPRSPALPVVFMGGSLIPHGGHNPCKRWYSANPCSPARTRITSPPCTGIWKAQWSPGSAMRRACRGTCRQPDHCCPGPFRTGRAGLCRRPSGRTGDPIHTAGAGAAALTTHEQGAVDLVAA